MDSNQENNNYIEIIEGSELNKKIQDKHLGKTFREILSETVKIPKNIGTELDLILHNKNDFSLRPMGNMDIAKTLIQNENTSVQIIKLSNIIMKMAVKYTQDIFMKKKKKQIKSELNELVDEIRQVKKILAELEKQIHIK